MKKILVLLLVLGLASFASATVIDIVKVGVGSMGHTGTIEDPLEASETIDLGVRLNYNPYYPGGNPVSPEYDGYVLSSLNVGLHVAGAGSLSYPGLAKTGLLAHNAGISPYANVGLAADGITQMTGVSLDGVKSVPGGLIIVSGIRFHCDGESLVPVALDLTLFGPTSVAAVNYPIPQAWYNLTEADLGDLEIYQKVPEPVTMTLLGLGGLALIRRRRA